MDMMEVSRKKRFSQRCGDTCQRDPNSIFHCDASSVGFLHPGVALMLPGLAKCILLAGSLAMLGKIRHGC